ncbi:tRNA (N(6)-L-threonylcarbamoyladenosine(37)-C(2))-methylthiotransferase MtaB [Hyphomicrobium sp.]|uniref:tRNA (N(6)-L-threonylcarbamoyladenosine(37)-C(2))- methylthiotransferase MtaB n=1 Tax=Hyphomicrobium sp. TaxID=82 RepID=UPI0025BC4858|nr:tRNA (N(6)-L-threonylcarbamoyladenosine(37)-C(2))-methylthiotransferase MtaB [Hyphomicrobium sp.]MCC7253540.1 tRNA (N(6)-L-threonylcarbamoyladenosine(37)-C(2))-methylthiotransferase MtaB [Hyphomicrobium sp.]
MSEPQIVTLGCRLNAYESEVMRRHAAGAGLGDCVIVNTCAVTGEAVRQAEQAIRKLRRERPGARLIVTGCAAQIEPERFAGIDGVDHVIGNAEKLAPETFRALATESLARVAVNDIMSVKETALHMIDGFGSRARAYVEIQNGCDHRCTFCIIPMGRGPSRSVPAGEVVSQVRKLVEAGYPEIVLTGVDITSYGADLPGRTSLGRLVKQILARVPELSRLRLSSIDQVEADAHLMDAIATEPRLMPHLHLSMQAGDDMILKRMKRRHLRDDAIRFCNEVRRLRPDVVFGADLIAGFPTETDDMFENTLDLVESCGLTYLHVFPFSPRKGTPAARMPQVDRRVVKERAARLREKGEAAHARYLDRLEGRRIEILMEREDVGRTPQFAEVRVDRKAPVGTFHWATLGRRDGRRLNGMVDA